ncbi:endoplasmic reticulum vesicle protein 25 [Acaromyces ingoldii]|uniref:Endoplasmic reticulum vesicle protein 25 n=1 Tax=Acaromyces ingoldii TaxID=215250 RepID=A0A316YPI5_9BASI|nr:endoplasmic reticulum vesicle protein 25 [Acaromyces ingoldii]PWN91450.1 endoplasmic reticulum vesicle protein 25 [Acaromyces ingoldii]
MAARASRTHQLRGGRPRPATRQGRHGAVAKGASLFTLTSLFYLVLCACVTSPVHGIKFDLEADTYPTTKCIWNYALADTLVIVTINSQLVSGDANDQRLDVDVVDGSKHNNIYLSKRNIRQETRMAINTHSHADLGVCLKNTLVRKGSAKSHVLTVDLDVDIGADAVDYNAIANQESLSGLETEMRKLEAVAGEIVNEMDYLKKREEKMRGTNESTNQRVENFAWVTLFGLVALGIWQVTHLRSFFQKRYLIDS